MSVSKQARLYALSTCGRKLQQVRFGLLHWQVAFGWPVAPWSLSVPWKRTDRAPLHEYSFVQRTD